MADSALRAQLETITMQCKEHVRTFLLWDLLPPAENAFEQRMLLSLGVYAAKHLTAEDDAILKACHDEGLHLLRDRLWHIKTQGIGSIEPLFEGGKICCLQPLSSSKAHLARLMAWVRTVEKENDVGEEDEEGAERADDARMPRPALYVWFMRILFACVMHLTDSKNVPLAVAREITVVQIGPNHSSVNTLQDAACGAWAAVRGQQEIEVYSLGDAGQRLVWPGQYQPVICGLHDFRTLVQLSMK